MIYWQRFIMQNDSGINKKIYLVDKKTLQLYKDAYHSDPVKKTKNSEKLKEEVDDMAYKYAK
jgi:hypothetical protein